MSTETLLDSSTVPYLGVFFDFFCLTIETNALRNCFLLKSTLRDKGAILDLVHVSRHPEDFFELPKYDATG